MTYGSLNNTLYATSLANDDPKVGDGATILRWTDRTAATVIEVKTPRCVVIREDKVTWGGVGSDTPTSVEPDANGRTYTARKNKDGKWRLSGYDNPRPVVLMGVRRPYYDWSF